MNQQKKKICIYNGQLFMGGIERVLISYLEMLSKDDTLDITLVIKENNKEKNVFYEDIPKNIKCIFIKTEEVSQKRAYLSKKKKNPLYRLMYQGHLLLEKIQTKIWLKKFFNENIFDVTIDFDSGLDKYNVITSKKSAVWVHYSLSNMSKKKRKRYSETFNRYTNIVVICNDMINEIAQKLPNIPQKKIVKIYNPMDIKNIIRKSNDKSGLTDEELELLKQPNMVAVSRLNGGKARHELIEIYPSLKARGIKEKLYIIGEGQERKNLEKMVKDLGLENDVFILGQKSNPYIWMKNSKLFLHPSYGEGLPTVLVEAMICESVVIAYDCPTGPKEILGNGKYGVLIDMGDKKAMEDAIYNCLTNESVRNKYLENSKEKINEFSLESIKKQLDEIL